MKVAILGAGNGGQAIAGYLAMHNYDVALYDIAEEKINELKTLGGIQLEGRIEGFGKVACITTDIAEAVRGAEIVMVTTVANAHRAVAKSIAPYIEEGQVIILNPGRTCGALVFKQTLNESGCTKRYYLGEAQTLVYACRVIENGHVNVIGIKGVSYRKMSAHAPQLQDFGVLNHLGVIGRFFRQTADSPHSSVHRKMNREIFFSKTDLFFC